MMQEYEFSPADTFSAAASTNIQPSEQILQNIMGFARCYQHVEAGGMQIKVCMN